MVVKSRENYMLFSIDNGIEEDLIDQEPLKAKYLNFLKKLFSTDHFEEAIVQNVLQSFKNALIMQPDDESSENVIVLKKQFELFSNDLEKYILEDFKEGFLEMSKEFQKPSFDPNAFFTNIERAYPELITSIRERLTFFKTL